MLNAKQLLVLHGGGSGTQKFGLINWDDNVHCKLASMHKGIRPLALCQGES